ncbi:MmgE/PrpD family protein [Saccharopolyspora dendranthemae]|uniref:2-methylcitrate dehydratase PrpD n=1 Tax=Saccharopolyspora dendranthemae TaxID=1181886 RepID=A0A561U2Q3_9PSEU|nr:MmgE/PrpD family protein [Saccharopolyspora dendranthemae]TWF93633.1 2-methylcitrate dehydratase PrpD [Saccharopolyspora dendranthemae]
MTTPAQRIGEVGARLATDGVADHLADDLVRRIVDVVGNSLAATREEPARIAGAVATEWSGTPESTGIGLAQRVPAPSAALVNGTLAHSLDFDDTHLPSVLHPSAAVVPAALATAERTGAGGRSLLAAAAMGIEVTCRLGMAGYDEELGNSVFFEHGQHATAICGAVGAAVASGMLQGLDAERLTSVIGIAASMGAGVIEANRTGGTIKRVHCGWAAHAGVAAADLARHGLTGPPTVIEGRFGFLRAFCGERVHPERVTDGLGEDWETPGVFFKPYPCNHFTHAGVDAALRMRERGVTADQVRELVLGVPAPVLRTIAEPAEEKRHPRSGYHAAFSGPYTVAAALLGGGGLGVFHEDFTDAAAADPRRLELAQRVRVVADDEATAGFPRQFPAVLTAELNDGTSVTERIRENRGGPQRPLSADELAAKFTGNAERAVGRDRAAGIVASLWDLRDDRPVAEVMSGLQRAAQPA